MTGRHAKAIDILSQQEFEVDSPTMFFKCESAVFAKGETGSLLYTTSLEKAEILAAILNDWVRLRKKESENKSNDNTTRYVIAARRDLVNGLKVQNINPTDWIGLIIGRISGLSIRGSAGVNGVQVDATPAAIKEARQCLGTWCHIEEEILHQSIKD